MAVKKLSEVPAYELFRPGDQVIVHQLENPDSGAVVSGAWPAEVTAAHLQRTVVVTTKRFPKWAKTVFGSKHSVSIKWLQVVSRMPRDSKNPNYAGILGKSMTSVYASGTANQSAEERKKIIGQIKHCAAYGMDKKATCAKLGMTMTTLQANCTKDNINFPAERWRYLNDQVPPMLRADEANRHC